MNPESHEPDSASSPFVWRQRFPSARQRVATARHLAAAVLGAWGIEGDDADTVVLVVSELVTNSVRHRHVPERLVELRLTYDRDKAVTVEVSDAHDHRPYPGAHTAPAELAESGRGLALIAAFADAWGVRDREGVGKTVWARLLVGQMKAG